MYIIFSDVDGTMLDHDLNLLDQTQLDIKRAQRQGIKFAICTGNSHFENMSALAQKIDADFLITSDGARIYDLGAQTIIYQQMLPQQQANQFLQAIKHLVTYVSWTTEKQIFMHVPKREYQARAISIHKKYNCKSGAFDFATTIVDDVYRISCSSTPANLELIAKQAQKHGLNYLCHNDSVTISAPETNKGAAIKALCFLKKVNLDQVMTIGDSFNDLSMIKITKNSYAMANAINALKKIARRHTSSVKQNGLGEAIIDFMFRHKIKN